MENLNIGLHQINTISGDLNGNFSKIKEQILKDKNDNCDLSIFPETALSGYMCGSLWDRYDFVDRQDALIYFLEQYIKDIDYQGVVILGFVNFAGSKTNGFPHLFNAAAFISKDGVGTYHKQLLASADHHEDKKYFDRGDKTLVFRAKLPNVGETKIGILICEDAWIDDHQRNIPGEMVKKGAKLLVHINQSYFYYGKQEVRRDLFARISKECNIPIISVNSCGVGDILKNIVIFDGGSTIFNKGELLFEAPRFQEDNQSFKLKNLKPKIKLPEDKYSEIFKALVFEQQEFFRLMGLKKAQVHISGGLDSAITAALVTYAMGKENVIFITNPSDLNSKSLKYVYKLSKALDVPYYTNPIQEIYDKMVEVNTLSFGSEPGLNEKTCIQAVLRTVQGLAASHRFKSGIVATGNHTEIVLGWANFHDIGSVGVHSIIGDLTKMELYSLAYYINEEIFGREIIPYDLFNGAFVPAAELPNANEDPIDYFIQSGICALLIRERMGKQEILSELTKPIPDLDYFPHTDKIKIYDQAGLIKEIDFAINCMKNSVYKAAQSPPIVIISPRSRGFSNRETLINKFNP